MYDKILQNVCIGDETDHDNKHIYDNLKDSNNDYDGDDNDDDEFDYMKMLITIMIMIKTMMTVVIFKQMTSCCMLLNVNNGIMCVLLSHDEKGF